jgi:hypothetical protein
MPSGDSATLSPRLPVQPRKLVAELVALGITVKMLTGDVCR